MMSLMNKIKKYDATLFCNVELSNISLCDVFIDPDLDGIIRTSNPISALKSKLATSKSSKVMTNISALQSPIWVYKRRNKYYLISGVLTHFLLVSTMSSDDVLAEKVPMILLNKKPLNDIKRLIFLADLSTQLLKKSFVTKEKSVKFFLENWFPYNEKKGNYLKNKEWQLLFPEITTKKELAGILNTSNRDL